LVDPNKEPDSSTKSHGHSEDNQDPLLVPFREKLLGFAVPENEKKGDADEKPKLVLSEKQLELSVKDDYSHDTLNVMTEAEKNSKAQDEAFKRKQELNALKDAEEAARAEEEAAKEEDDESDAEKEEGEGEEEVGDLDDIEYEVFYDQE